MNKINLKGVSEYLSEQEMKKITGGYDLGNCSDKWCSGDCQVYEVEIDQMVNGKCVWVGTPGDDCRCQYVF